jgi:hypothetical protein
MDFAGGFESDRAVAVQLNLALEVHAFGKLVRAQQKHRLDEARLSH